MTNKLMSVIQTNHPVELVDDINTTALVEKGLLINLEFKKYMGRMSEDEELVEELIKDCEHLKDSEHLSFDEKHRITDMLLKLKDLVHKNWPKELLKVIFLESLTDIIISYQIKHDCPWLFLKDKAGGEGE
jgi:hypothetical protein